MKAGKLDRILIIERLAVAGDDGAGNHVGTWQPVATLRAEIIEATTRRLANEATLFLEETIHFRTRFLDGVTITDRVRFESRVLGIAEVKVIGRRRGLELRTERP